ncbi:MAG TPA: TlpA disulfide reductase family protein [Ilumatobacter sp.]|nr:TlpA disulfide reductase family protein [Ilumatobacter sp.]
MTRPSYLRAAAMIAAVLLAGCGGDDEGVGLALPDVLIAPIDGSASTSLADLDGPAVVNLWATSCAPCRAEIPAFEAVYQTRGDTVAFVGLNIGESAEQAAPFIAEVGATYPQYLDELGYAVTELNVSAMPTTIVIDADGTVTTRHIGPMDVTELNAAIDDALK